MAISEKKREREHKINFAGKSLYSDIGSDPFCHNEKTKLLVLTPNQAHHCFYCWGEADLRKQWSTYLNLLNRAWSQNEVPLIKFYMVFLTDSFESNNGFFIFPDILQTSMFIKRRRIDLIIVRYAYNNHTLIIHV